MVYTKENVVPDIRKASDFDRAMKDAFSNFTSATNSEQEIVYVNPKDGVNAMNSAQDIWQNFGGRRRSCKSAGLTGAERRACQKQLKAIGWKKGDPIPDSVVPNTSALTPADMTDPSLASKGSTAPQGMSTGMKWGIGIGLTVVFGLGIYAIATMKPKVTPMPNLVKS